MKRPPRPTTLGKCGCSFDMLRKTSTGFEWFCWRHNETAPTADDSALVGREARCTYCGKTASSTEHAHLAFFESRHDKTYDRYYCGCRGWD